MLEELTASIDFENLPEEPRETFVEVFDRILDHYETKIKNTADPQFKMGCRQVGDALELSARALELRLDFPRLPPPSDDPAKFQSYLWGLRRVRESLKKEIASEAFINAFKANEPKPAIDDSETITISNAALVAIHPQLQSLRNSIAAVTIEAEKRDRLLELLNDFERELNSKEVSKNGSLKRLAVIGGMILGTTTFLAEAPEAIETIGSITAYLGSEIDAADQALLIEKEQVALLSGPKPKDG